MDRVKTKKRVPLSNSSLGPALLRTPRAFSPRQPRPLAALGAAVPGFHTGKALCRAVLSDVTSKSSSLALKTWIPSRVPGTPNRGSPVCEGEARSPGGNGTLWLKCLLNNSCTTEPLLFLLLLVKGNFKIFRAYEIYNARWTEGIMHHLNIFFPCA